MTVTVLGLDLSLTSTGVAMVTPDGPDFVGETWTIKTAGARAATLAERHARLQEVKRRIVGHAHNVDMVVIEAPAYSRANPGMHDRSGLWWLVVSKLVQLGHTVVEVAPSARAKYATGKGNSSKDAVLAAVVRRYLAVGVAGNDEADALVLAAMGCRALARPIDDVPLSHLTGMSKVAWPTHTRQLVAATAPF